MPKKMVTWNPVQLIPQLKTPNRSFPRLNQPLTLSFSIQVNPLIYIVSFINSSMHLLVASSMEKSTISTSFIVATPHQYKKLTKDKSLRYKGREG